MDALAKKHFFNLILRSASSIHLSTTIMFSMCFFKLLENITTSIIYTLANVMSFTNSVNILRNVAWSFIKPTGITSNVNVPYLKVKRVKSLHSSGTGICLKLQKRSVVVK